MNSETLETLILTAELVGHRMSEAAARLLAADLDAFPDEAVVAALAGLRRSHRGPLTAPAIIAAVEAQDGRPGAEEAWALVPKDEYTTVVMTREMSQAWGASMPLYEDGDKVAARMVFKEKYEAAVKSSRRDLEPVKWTASLGWDKSGRAGPLADAVEQGKIGFEQVAPLLSGPERHEFLALVGANPAPELGGPNAKTIAAIARALKVKNPELEHDKPQS